MNYIQLMNQFWLLRRSKRITNLQADVYYFLLNESNIREWENPFQSPNGIICSAIGISEKSLIDARNVLQQLGLINFENGVTKQKSPTYYLLKVSIGGSNRDSIGDSINVSNRGGKKVVLGCTLNTKQNKTKQEEEDIPLFTESEKLISKKEKPIQERKKVAPKKEMSKIANLDYLNLPLQNISISETELNKLISEKGKEVAEAALLFLSSYKIEKSYTTKSDYHTILRWVIDAVLERNKKTNQNANTNQPKSEFSDKIGRNSISDFERIVQG